MRTLIRLLFEALVRFYYPDLRCEGEERLRALAGKPVVFAPNHPNALLDPLVLRIALRRDVAFLAKSTLFRSPVTRLVLEAFGAFPVFRQKDGEVEGPDRGDKNEETFARCRDLLAKGGSLALFPEGTSHSDPTMKPLKTGAARIALSAEAAHGFGLGVTLVPVGMSYEAKTTFRSRALVVLGEPIACLPYAAAHEADERAAVRELTSRLREGMDEVVLQAETREVLDGVARVAAYAHAPAQDDLGARHAKTLELLVAYQRYQAKDPARLERLVARAQSYMKTLELLGVEDPWALELGRLRKRVVSQLAVALLLTAPLALVGACLGWAPYRAAGRVAARVAGEEDVLGTVKLLGGALFLLVAWSVEGALFALRFGAASGVLFFLFAMTTGWIALRWDETFVRARAALRALLVRQGPTRDALVAERRALASEIEAALLAN